MKKLAFLSTLTFAVFISLISLAFAQESSGARLEYTKEAEDLGTLYTVELENIVLDVEFINDGDQPLVISSVRGCCGTRIKDFPKEPVMPGEKAFVTVEFRPAPRPHTISRKVSIMSNDVDGIKVFYIKGKVAESDDAFGVQLNNIAGPRVN